jgi:hypothetical protein
VRDAAGGIVELQFWHVQGFPSLDQLRQVLLNVWPKIARREPERLVFKSGLLHFSVSVSGDRHVFSLVEERPTPPLA